MSNNFFLRTTSNISQGISRKLPTDNKTKTVAKNVVYSAVIKVINICISFLSVPLLINYLSSTQYGIWLTIITFTSWFSIFDLGLGNGLKNKLIEFLSINDIVSAKRYVGTTYLSMTVICCSVCLLIFFLNPLISWNVVFNTTGQVNGSISAATMIILTFTLLSMLLRLINSLLHAYQQSYKVDVINFVYQLVGFISLLIVRAVFKPSLVVIALAFSLSQLFTLVVINIYLFVRSFKPLIPSFDSFDRKLVREVTNIGGRFFFIQVAGLVMYMTDNFIIARLFGPNDVTVYNVALKYFSILITGWSLVMIPLWPMTTKAYYAKDMTWISKMMKKMIVLWMVTIVIGLIMFFCSDMFYALWVGKKIIIAKDINFFILIYSCVSVFATIMATFINGMGKIKLQVYITGFVAVINIPLAIFFSRTLSLGIIGVPLATTTCLAISSIFAFMQSHQIINNKAVGIWNK